MSKLWTIALVAAAACSKSSPPAEQVSTAAADALWAMCPPTATSGFVVTPRALQHVEAALVEVQRFLGASPDLAMLREQINGAISAQLGGPFASLADVGLDGTKGLAMFDGPDGGVVILPLANREKLAKLAIPVGTDPNKIGDLTCRTIAGMYACSKQPAQLDAIGRARLPAALATVGARGDIEVMMTSPVELGVAVRVERGAVTLRGAVVAPPVVAQKLVGASRPRIAAGTTSAFMVATVDALVQSLPDGPLLPDLTLGELLETVGGPVTVTIAAGTQIPEVHVPLTDPVPAQRIVDACATIVPPELLAAQQQPGTCRLHVAAYNLDLDIWVDGKELRTGLRAGAPAAKQVALTPLGDELAKGEWTLAFWGRGTMYGAKLASSVPAEMQPMLRALALLSELGVAARLDGNVARFVIGARTVWANPPAVAQQLLAVPLDKLMDPATAGPIAASAPSSPFAADYAAGQGGLLVPSAILGLVAGIVVPAFMQYLREPLSGPLVPPSPTP